MPSSITAITTGLEPELIADWRLHYAHACGQMQALAMLALRRAQEASQAHDPTRRRSCPSSSSDWRRPTWHPRVR